MKKYLPQFRGEKVIFNSGGTVADVVEIVKAVAKESQSDPFFRSVVRDIHKHFKDPEDALYMFCQLLHTNAPFESDPPGHQRIRSPRRLFFDERGNCIDYSTAILAFCEFWNIPCILRIVSWSNDSPLSHIYPVINGVPYDLVQGQSEKGDEYLKLSDERVMIIGEEKPYARNVDINAL